jgi:hypothetical protein
MSADDMDDAVAKPDGWPADRNLADRGPDGQPGSERDPSSQDVKPDRPRESIWRRIPASTRWSSALAGTGWAQADPPASPEPVTEPDPSAGLALDTTVELPVVIAPGPADSPGVRRSTGRKGFPLAVAVIVGAAVAVVAVTLGLSSAHRQSAGVAAWVPANATTPPATGILPPTPTVGAPVTYEAEAASNALTGSAFAGRYQGASGGRVVENIGRWSGGPGTLRFNRVTAPTAGRYTLTYFFLHVNGEATRTVTIVVSQSQPITVTASGGSTCCARQVVTVFLQAGPNAITFANPRGHAPAIDKIEISAAPS